MNSSASPVDIRPDHLEIVHDILRAHLPAGFKVWVFGSRANWTTKDSSDLDLAVEGASSLDHRAMVRLEVAFEESRLPYNVDVVDLNAVSPSFKRLVKDQMAPLPLANGRRSMDSDWNHLPNSTAAGQAKSGEWPVATINDIAEKVAMGPFGSSIKVETFVPEGVPIISGQHLHGFRVDDAPGFNFISHEHAQRLANANVQRGDIVFTHAGNIGSVAYIPEDSEFERYVISQRQFYMRCDRMKAIPEFVTVYFKSYEGQHQLLANSSQVGVPSIAQPVTYLRTIEIPLPPLTTQRAIAHVLGTLDDKIELNRRMNETLEGMARALFKSWFVDFDPVRAKAALKQHTLYASAPEAGAAPAAIAERAALEGESSDGSHTPAALRYGASHGGSHYSPGAGSGHSPVEGPHNSPGAGSGHSPVEGPHNSPSAGSGHSAVEGPHNSPLEGESAGRGRPPPPSRWGEVQRSYSRQTLQRAKALRQRQTDAEGLLWHYLRRKQLGGYKFRRQQPIGPYVADFACMSEKLLVELDGGQHAERAAHDRRRTEFLESKGFRVLRFWNHEMFEDCFALLQRVYESLAHPPPRQAAPAATPPQGGSDVDVPADYTGGRTTPPRGGSDGTPDAENDGSAPPGAWTPERARAYLAGMDQEIVDLFPDRLAPSELGEIPEGWGVKALGECFSLTMGQSPPGSTYNDDGKGLPFFQGSTDFGERYPTNRRYCTEPARLAQTEDTLVSVRAPVGAINRAWERCCIGRGVAALRHKSGSAAYTYYATWTAQPEIGQYEHTGTVFGAITKSQFEALQVIEPDTGVISVFNSCARPLDERIRSNVAESRALSSQRDALLPKLVSGRWGWG